MPNTRCLRLNLTSLVCALVVCATTSIAQSQENQLPETAQGRVISSYLAAYNSGSSETMATFNQAYRTAEALARRSPKEHDDMYKRIRSQFGDVTFHSVADLTDDQITIVIENDNQQWFDMTFTFKGDDQPLIESIQLRGPVSEPGQTIDQALVESTIEGVLEALNTTYVFPEVAAEMEKAVRAKAEAGRYDDVTDAGDLAEMLTEDLREVCHDLHLSVRAGSRPGGPNPTPEQRAERMAQDRERNFYFDEPQILEGNIGYIKFDGFHGSDEAHEVVAKFMEQVLDTDALIFDVRANGGGSPNMIMFLSSYLFDEPVHLNSFYNRHTDETQHFWSKAEVPGGVK
ncbi:MAG: S41 family peptidase, partial [Planctomycetota bacterium]|nr:S41 family peptidase [Planctomycetota bacterium]